jgi:CBS domain containing-hemolysin-like protein
MMKKRSIQVAVALLVLVAFAAVVHAQMTSATLPPSRPTEMTITTDTQGRVLSQSASPSDPLVLSGDQVGIRVAGVRNGKVFGTLVVKVDGKWSEVHVVGENTPAAR